MLVIKKTVSLDFLGEDYKDAYIVFKSIPLKDYDEIIDAPQEGKDALVFVQKVLEKYFLAGKFPDENGKVQDLTKEDIAQLDGETAVKCFEVLSGTSAGSQTDPLAVESLTQSKTEVSPQPNS